MNGEGGARRAPSAAASRRPELRPPRAPDPLAADCPVARVLLDVPLAHLDRLFDYTVTQSQSADAVPGVRVRARFAGRLVDGFVVERRSASDHPGPLSGIRRVLSGEPVLAPDVLDLAREVAQRWAGSVSDVLRLAVPPRHARVEREAGPAPQPSPLPQPLLSPPPQLPQPQPQPAPAPGPRPTGSAEPGAWGRYAGGPAFLAKLSAGEAPRASWLALPDEDWPGALATAAQAALRSGRGALLVLPDVREVGLVDAALRAVLGEGHHLVLTSELGPEERYRRFLAVRRGVVSCVVGNRSAVYAPVARLGLVALWDDGDDLHAEPHAPYAHAREVLALRAHAAGAGALFAGFSRSTEVAALVDSGWARSLAAVRATVRQAAPRIRVADGDLERSRDPAAAAARIPSVAWRLARDALQRGPVLVQVPRSGYVPALVCGNCRAPARCRICSGPLSLADDRRPPACAWCGRTDPDRRCAACGSAELRAAAVGNRRTGEEIGRAFPGVPVRVSGGDDVLGEVPPGPGIVVATPGAEPRVAGGYAAALLLDGWALLGRPDLRAEEEALRRWMGAAALVRPASAGGAVVVVADPGARAVQALVRWDPAGFAARELAVRTGLGLPPAARLATLTGPPDAVADLLARVTLPPGTEIFGPVDVPTGTEPFGRVDVPTGTEHFGRADLAAGAPSPSGAPGGERPTGAMDTTDESSNSRARAVLRVPRAQALPLARALRAGQAARTARKRPGHVRIQLDPLDVG